MHTAKANETIINESEGMFYCSGGAQTYILSTNCKKLTLKRIIVGSAMAYEGQCLDNNNKDHVFACQSYAFTYKNRVIQKEDFWTKSKKNK
ncbi:MAG TPA: hypothetical protein PKC21_07105 [Oligoflexia bacterium]|nr:hypothetical protein [Oligoflexia bacterium]HMR25105.1 hypothetical protein [Oligoflexia bacterium]